MENRRELRGFSKKHNQEQRDATAHAIKEQRASHFQKTQEADSIEESKDGLEQKLEKFIKQTQRLQEEYERMTRSLFSRIKNFMRINFLDEQINQNELKQEELVNQLEEKNQILSLLDERIKNEGHLVKAQLILDDFYQKQALGLKNYREQQYLEERPHCQIENICVENNVYIIHGVRFPTPFTTINSGVVTGRAPLEFKLDLIEALQPTLSTSSVTYKNYTHKLVSGVGVVLKGGEVESASPEDAGTLVDKQGGRESWAPGLPQRITKAVRTERNKKYNELTVKQPEIGGYVISTDIVEWDSFSTYCHVNNTSLRGLYEELSGRGAPVYFLDDGILHLGQVTEDQEILLQEAVTPEDIVQSKYETSKQKRVGMLSSALENIHHVKHPAHRDYISKTLKELSEA